MRSTGSARSFWRSRVTWTPTSAMTAAVTASSAARSARSRAATFTALTASRHSQTHSRRHSSGERSRLGIDQRPAGQPSWSSPTPNRQDVKQVSRRGANNRRGQQLAGLGLHRGPRDQAGTEPGVVFQDVYQITHAVNRAGVHDCLGVEAPPRDSDVGSHVVEQDAPVRVRAVGVDDVAGLAWLQRRV